MRSALALAIVLAACTAEPYAKKGAPTGEAPAKAAPTKEAPEAKTPEAKPEPEPEPEPAPKPEPVAAKTIEEAVELVEAGKEPQAPLAWKPDGTQTVQLVIDMALGMTMPNRDVPSTVIPSIAAEMEMRVLDAKEALQLQWRIKQAGVGEFDGVSPDVVKAVGQAAFELEKAKGAIESTFRGLARKVAVEAKGLSSPTLRPTLTCLEQSFVQLYPAFPEEPVGTGARWKTTTEGFVSGFAIKHEAVYTLQERKGDVVTLAVEFTQTDRDNGELLQTEGKGTLTVDLTKPAPTTADVTSKSRIQSQAVTMNMTLALKMD